MKRETIIVKGPHFEKAKKNCHKYLIEMAKRYVEEGKYTKSIS